MYKTLILKQQRLCLAINSSWVSFFALERPHQTTTTRKFPLYTCNSLLHCNLEYCL